LYCLTLSQFHEVLWKNHLTFFVYRLLFMNLKRKIVNLCFDHHSLHFERWLLKLLSWSLKKKNWYSSFHNLVQSTLQVFFNQNYILVIQVWACNPHLSLKSCSSCLYTWKCVFDEDKRYCLILGGCMSRDLVALN